MGSSWARGSRHGRGGQGVSQLRGASWHPARSRAWRTSMATIRTTCSSSWIRPRLSPLAATSWSSATSRGATVTIGGAAATLYARLSRWRGRLSGISRARYGGAMSGRSASCGSRRGSSAGKSCGGSARRGDRALSLIGEHSPSQLGRPLRPFDHPLRRPMTSYQRDTSRVPCPPLCLSARPHSAGSPPRRRLRSAQAQARCSFASQLRASLRS